MKEIVQSSFYDSNALIRFKNIKHWRKFEIEEICERIILGKVEVAVSGGCFFSLCLEASMVSCGNLRRVPWNRLPNCFCSRTKRETMACRAKNV